MAEKVDEINAGIRRWHDRMKKHELRARQDKPPKVQQIQFNVAIENDHVLLRFGKPALQVAQDIVKKVRRITGNEGDAE